MNIEGKTAIITGAGRGIGYAIAEEFGRAGAQLILHYNKSKSGVEKLQEQFGALLVQADLKDPESCRQLINATDNVDILVNNAGCNNDMLVLAMEDEDWNSVLDVNLTAVFRLCREAGKHMMSRRCGSIVNITSVSGISPNRGQANYAASKAAVYAFSRSFAKEMARMNIRCNCVAPGLIDTQMLEAMNPKARTIALKQIPMRRAGNPTEIAKVVRFLASDDASYVTGQEWVVDGGLL